MDRKFLLALGLSLGVMLVWYWLFPPPPPAAPPKPSPSTVAESAPPAPSVDSTARSATAEPSTTPETAPATPPPPVEGLSPEERTLETELYTLRVGNRGARILSWQLKKYSDDAGKPLDLISIGAAKTGRFPLDLEFADAKLAEKLRGALFNMAIAPSAEGDESRIRFEYSDGAGLSVRKILYLPSRSYVSRLEVDVRQNGTAVPAFLIWGAGLGAETGLKPANGSGNEAARGVVARGGKILRLPKDSLKGSKELIEPGGIQWGGLEDHYFAGIILPAAGSPSARLSLQTVIEEGREKEFLALGMETAPPGQYRLFVGPKDHEMLASLHLGIEGLVDFGLSQSIAQGLFFLLKAINRVTLNWGWAIIILTLIIRLAFWPLTHRSSVSMRRTQEKMKKVNPKVQAIREKFRKMKRDMANRQKMNEEIMALYQKEGMNPLAGMSGCLPLLLQLPILWGFYNLLVSAIELRHAPFALWITDLSKKDPYYVTPVVMGITMLIQQAMTGSSIPDPTQRRIMMLMPVMFTWFFKDLPSGLVLYWLVNNVLAIAQQYVINLQVARETETARAGKG